MSLLDRLDPRTRVAAAALFAAAVTLVDGLPALTAAVALAIGLAALGALPVGRTARRLLALEGFMAAALATLPFTVPGDAVAVFWGHEVTAQGLHRALVAALKANAATLSALALLSGLEPVALGGALARLGVPERFVTLFLLTLRYVDVLEREYARLRLAMRARGFRMTSSLHTWRSMGWLAGMLLVNSVERSERIHAAMRLRGFTGRLHRHDESKAGPWDWGFGAAHVAALALLAALDVSA